MNVDAYIKEYEQMTGRKASKVVRRFAKGLFSIGTRFEDRGREDGAKGLPVPGADAFTHWASKVFDNDPETAANMAELMQMAYMHGYKEGGGIIDGN